MQIVALDGAKLLALMLAGAVFALAGLWLMFRPQPAGEAARIELFGMKLQASSAGLLVFLIGAVFLAVPIFVPERDAPPATSVLTGANSVSRADAPTPGTAAPAPRTAAPSSEQPASEQATGGRAIILPGGAEAAEMEPNNTIHEANQIVLGTMYSGSLAPASDDALDWYVLDTSNVRGQEIEIQVRSVVQGVGCQVSAHDHREQRIGNYWLFPSEGSSNYKRVFVGNADHMFLRFHAPYDMHPCRYEFRVNRAPA